MLLRYAAGLTDGSGAFGIATSGIGLRVFDIVPLDCLSEGDLRDASEGVVEAAGEPMDGFDVFRLKRPISDNASGVHRRLLCNNVAANRRCCTWRMFVELQ